MVPVNKGNFEAWVNRYVRAWRSSDEGEIASLFTRDADYYSTPHRKPWSGREEIISGWIGRCDQPDDWEFEFEVLGVDGPRGFVRGETIYKRAKTRYSNLWVITLADNGECREFIEWWMEQ